MADTAKWYVVHTYSGYENTVKVTIEKTIQSRQLQEQILAVNIPMETVTEITESGVSKTYDRKLYPGYVYLNFALRRPDGELNNDAWYKIQAVDGVISFACGRSKKPLPMSARDVRELMAEIARRSEGSRQKIVFNVKDEVVVLEGAFQGERGIVEEVDTERGRLRVGVTMFGRSNPLDLDYTQVQLVPEDERGNASKA